MEKHVKQSISIIQELQTETAYFLGFSGGKDSIVLYDLAVKSGVNFKAIHANTTIDPPGTLKFIRNNFDVEIMQPQKSFFQLVKEKGLPGRLRRFCCEHLKERYGIGKRSLEGMRKAESNGRKFYEPEQCDTRRFMKGAKHILPILEWSDAQIWAYIHDNNLPYMKYYDAPYNFDRHGCVGCPLAQKWKMRKEFKALPKFAFALISAIKKHMEYKPNNFLAQNFDNEYEAFYFYLHEKSVLEIKEMKTGFFKYDFRQVIESWLSN